jgi:hypothetical protein
MEVYTPKTAPHFQNWTDLQKNAFRFFFIFLSSTSIFAYNIVSEILVTFFTKMSYPEAHKAFAVLSRPLEWIDHHLFHMGFTPGKDDPFFSDGRYGWVTLLTLIFLSIGGTIIWAIADRKRANYNRLHYWFRTYLAYYLFLAMIMYAIEKIIPVQMPYPNIPSLLRPLGENSKINLMWDFVGISPPYSLFTGLCELIASLLILFRRTRVVGSLFMTIVLTNVVCFNIFYGIIVKLASLQLLFTTLFLLAPYIPKLFRFFFYLQPVSLAEKQYIFKTAWKKWVIVALLIVPVWMCFYNIERSMRLKRRNSNNRKQERLYDVRSFVKGRDTLAPLLTDTLRWKRFALTDYQGTKYAVIYYMAGDDQDWFNYQVDSSKKLIVLIDAGDTTKRFPFNFSEPGKNQLLLQGKWMGNDFHILMDKVEIDSMRLVREKVTWIQNH